MENKNFVEIIEKLANEYFKYRQLAINADCDSRCNEYLKKSRLSLKNARTIIMINKKMQDNLFDIEDANIRNFVAIVLRSIQNDDTI